jgi:hypothetical protein
MRRLAAHTLLAMGLVVSVVSMALAQVPAAGEAQAIWNAFWSRVLAGDLRGAYRYVHPTRLGFPLQRPVDQLQGMAHQMLHCRLASDPLPDSGEDVLFEVLCEHAGEKVQLLVGFRQDATGAWRLTVI